MNNICGIGTDIMKRERIERILSGGSEGDFFVKMTYSPKEVEAIESAPDPVHRYATHFCGKEAVFKALSLGGNTPFKWHQIEILYEPSGKPYVCLKGSMAEAARERGIGEVMISLSYDSDYVSAFAVAVGNPAT